MSIKSLITVDGIALPMPSTYSAGIFTIVDSARNTQGEMVGSVVRDNVAKIDVTWRELTIKEWANILQLFERDTGGQFVNFVKFFDPARGKYFTREMYVGDRKADGWRVDPKTGNIVAWRDCTLNLIEV